MRIAYASRAKPLATPGAFDLVGVSIDGVDNPTARQQAESKFLRKSSNTVDEGAFQ